MNFSESNPDSIQKEIGGHIQWFVTTRQKHPIPNYGNQYTDISLVIIYSIFLQTRQHSVRVSHVLHDIQYLFEHNDIVCNIHVLRDILYFFKPNKMGCKNISRVTGYPISLQTQQHMV